MEVVRLNKPSGPIRRSGALKLNCRMDRWIDGWMEWVGGRWYSGDDNDDRDDDVDDDDDDDDSDKT